MKTFIQNFLFLLLIIGSMGCYKKYSLGERVTDLKIVVTQTDQPNVYNFSTSTNAVIANWDLGNGTKAMGTNSITGSFPFAGKYNVTLTAYGQAGQTNTVSIILPVLEDNYNLLQDPVYTALCGEIGNPDGQTWVIDRELRGHIIMWNNNSTTGFLGDSRACPYSAISNGADLRFGPTLYDDEVTFKLNNTDGPAFLYNTGDGKVLVSNTGSNAVYNNIFLNALSWSPSAGVPANTISIPAGYTGNYNSDWQVPCTPPAGMNWTLVKGADGSYTINSPNVKNGTGGFLLFNTDWSEGYKIISLTNDRLVVKKKTAVNGTTRQIVLIKKGTPSGLPLTLDKLPETASLVK